MKKSSCHPVPTSVKPKGQSDIPNEYKLKTKTNLRSFGYGASQKTANFPALTDCSSTRQMARLGASSVKALSGASGKGVSSPRSLVPG